MTHFLYGVAHTLFAIATFMLSGFGYLWLVVLP